jgi:protein SCO1/2
VTEAGLPRNSRRAVPVGLAAAVLVGTAALGIVGGVLVRTLLRSEPRTTAAAASPAFHGQGVWAPGARPAPDFALRDQRGTLVTLRALRGRPVLLTFLDSQCTSRCPIEGRQLGSILRRLPRASRPVVVVVSVDRAGDTTRAVGRALAKWGLDGPWSLHWLNAQTHARLAAVWRAYGVRVEPTSNDIVHSLALYLVDRHGDERTAYLFPFLPSFVRGDLVRLARGTA